MSMTDKRKARRINATALESYKQVIEVTTLRDKARYFYADGELVRVND
jgi:hypothetical protein